MWYAANTAELYAMYAYMRFETSKKTWFIRVLLGVKFHSQSKMGKIKKENVEGNESSVKEEDLYDEKVKNANKIACPMASKKLTKKCYKLVKKGKAITFEFHYDNSNSFIPNL